MFDPFCQEYEPLRVFIGGDMARKAVRIEQVYDLPFVSHWYDVQVVWLIVEGKEVP